MLNRLRVLASEVEGSKGTAETLVAADANILVEDARFAFAPETLTRDYTRSTLSQVAAMMGARVASINFRTELKGSGTATTPPAWGKLLKGCGCSETVGSSNVVYAPDSVDADSETMTMSVLIGSGASALIRKLYGARGTGTITWTANQIVYGDFTFTGIYDATTTGNQLTGTGFDATNPEVWLNAALQLGGSYTPDVVSTFSLDLNHEVRVRPSANATTGLMYALITNRTPSGNLSIETVTTATYDAYGKMMAETEESLAFNLGSAAGNTLAFAAPKFQITSIGDDDEEDMAHLGLNFQLNGNAGDDEWTITHS